MKTQTLDEAITEAERFLKLTRELAGEPEDTALIWGSKLSGATRRASMDLTRKLADLRQGK